MDFYKRDTNLSSFYGTAVTSTGEVNFRKELYDILYTEDRGTEIVYRRAKLQNGAPMKCKCTKNNRSYEPDRDIKCELCDGLGYYFNDYIVRTYVNHTQAYSIYKRTKRVGDAQVEYRTLYFEWDFLKNLTGNATLLPNRFDRIIELDKDIDGGILSPLTTRKMYEILSVDPYRLDNNGRIEYYRIRIISVTDESFLI